MISPSDDGTRSVERVPLVFASEGTPCAALHYVGTNGGCVVMAGGLGVPKEPGTDRFAAVFRSAGYSVLAFDYRYLGESGGQPRGIVRVREQLSDWENAIAAAARLPEVDPARIAIWGFSLSGGHVFQAAAHNHAVAAAIAQTPNADGSAATRNALRHQRVGALARFTFKAVLDTFRGAFGREPWMVPLAGPPGTVAVLTTPDALDGDRALNPENRYPTWNQTLAARSALPLGRYRPGTATPRVTCPLLVLVCDNDQSALAEPAVAAATTAPLGELVRMPGGHYEPFLDGHAHAAGVQVDFLNRHLLESPGATA